MFEDLYDEISKLWAWRWPVVEGTVVAAEIERAPRSSQREAPRLSVVYSFFVADDGPYGGEGFWQPPFSFKTLERLREARRTLRVGHKVLVRYRPDDPSVNKLDRRVWKEV